MSVRVRPLHVSFFYHKTSSQTLTLDARSLCGKIIEALQGTTARSASRSASQNVETTPTGDTRGSNRVLHYTQGSMEMGH